MEEQLHTITIQTLDSGEAASTLNQALNDLLSNILDPRTEATQKRKVTLEVEVKPNEERNMGSLIYKVKQSFAPTKSEEVSLMIDERGGQPVAFEPKTGRPL